LKAGTATKLVLNMLTTGAMVRLGKCYGNLMVDLTATNEKLRLRTNRIVRDLTGLDKTSARDVLDRCNGELKTAIVAHKRQVAPDEARRLLESANGQLRAALTPDPRPLTPNLILGIDAGGTSVVAWLSKNDPAGALQRLGRGTAGPANPHSVGWDVALRQIDTAIAAAFADAGLPRGPVAALCLAAAGAAREAEQKRLSDWAIAHGWAATVEVVHDAQPVLAAGTPEGWGIAVIAGTGSLVFGRAPDGATARAGGWGPLLGDEGSGYAIAIDGLRAAVRAIDGRGPHTRLATDLFAALNVASADQLIAAIYDSPHDRAHLARLAQIVTQAAAQNDRVAEQILDHAAEALAEQVAVVTKKLNWPTSGIPVGLAGGVLTGTELVFKRLAEHLRRQSIPVSSIQVVPEPVAGAAMIARQAIRSGNPQIDNPPKE
jgi:N-acetylglucosamine kinase-like BadF-type ATPase